MKVRARLAAALAVLSIGVGAAVATAQPVAASSGMQICLRNRTNMILTNVGVYSEVLVQGAWYPTQLMYTGNNGCVGFLLNGVERDYPARLRVPNQRYGPNTIWANTYSVPAGNQYTNFGWWNVVCGFGGPCYGF